MISPDFPKKPPSSDDDHALWDYVTRDIHPLGPQNLVPRVTSRTKGSVGSRSTKAGIESADSPAAVPDPLPRADISRPGAQEVDRRTAQRLKRGQYEIDATLDLHGLTQVAAHKKLVAALQRAYTRQQRCVLVITGKGSREAGTGVIKRAVPDWLAEAPLSAIVLRYETAQPEHGGAGALYVLLRRQRTDVPGG